jgi:hypothetical protein
MRTAALACLLLCAPLFASNKVRDEVVSPYCEVIVDGKCAGAGVMIDHRGRVSCLTAKHVIDGGKTFAVKRGKETIPCRLQATDDTADLALLRPLHPVDWPTAHVPKAVNLRWGERLWSIGTPGGVHSSLTPGTCNGPRWRYKGRLYLRYSGDGWYGNSGGGVYCYRGGTWVLCGITVALADAGNPRSALFAEPLPAIRAFLKKVKR